jgi:hypothetical protein
VSNTGGGERGGDEGGARGAAAHRGEVAVDAHAHSLVVPVPAFPFLHCFFDPCKCRKLLPLLLRLQREAAWRW